MSVKLDHCSSQENNAKIAKVVSNVGWQCSDHASNISHPSVRCLLCCVLLRGLLHYHRPVNSATPAPAPAPAQAWRWARGCSCNENESCSFLLTFGASTSHTCVVLHLSPKT